MSNVVYLILQEQEVQIEDSEQGVILPITDKSAEMIKPLPMESQLKPDDQKTKTHKPLAREDSDMMNLLSNEQSMASTGEYDNYLSYICRSATASSGNTLLTSINSNISGEDIPYIDSSEESQ